MNTSPQVWRAALSVMAGVALLLGCQGAMGVKELSPTTYSASAQYGLLFGGWNLAQQEAVATAKQYCATKGDIFAFISEQRSGSPGFTPLKSTVTFSCGQDTAVLMKSVISECKDLLKTPELDPIRSKVELYRESYESAVPFIISANDSFPTQQERAAIARWASLREDCVKRSEAEFALPPSATPLQVTQIQEDRSFGQVASATVGDLIVSLYQLKLTYGEFARKRYEITHASAEAERQYRQSTQLADQQQRIQAQHLAQQQFQNNLVAWSTYMQAENARQPQTVHLDGTIRIQ